MEMWGPDQFSHSYDEKQFDDTHSMFWEVPFELIQILFFTASV